MTAENFAPRGYRCAFCPAADYRSLAERQDHERREHGDQLASIRRDAELSRQWKAEMARGEDPE